SNIRRGWLTGGTTLSPNHWTAGIANVGLSSIGRLPSLAGGGECGARAGPLRLDLPDQLPHGAGDLSVATGGGIARMFPDHDVGDRAVEFQIGAVAFPIPAAEGQPQGAEIHDAGGAGGDYP